MKGVSLHPLNRRNCQKANLALGDKWLDVEFLSLRFASKGGVTNVVRKAAALCSSNLAKIVNIRSTNRGFGYKGYNYKWRWPRRVSKMVSVSESLRFGLPRENGADQGNWLGRRYGPPIHVAYVHVTG